MLDPRQHHAKRHRDRFEAFEDCWVCGRDRAICKTKIRFASWEEANEWTDDFNAERGWRPPYVMRYPCRWCDGWHMKTAKHPRDVARMEKLARKRRGQQ